jgi:hypothetical protein
MSRARRLIRPLSVAASVVCLLLLSRSGGAVDARAEAAARTALKRAPADYHLKHYSVAAARLEKALRACQDDQCAPKTKAALLRDLGTMQFRQGDTDSASKSFAEALALAPDLSLNRRYDRPDLRAAWDQARQRAAASASQSFPGVESADAGPSSPAAPEPPPPAPPAAGARAKPGASADETATLPPPTTAEETPGAPAEQTLRYAHLWVGVAGAIDFINLPTGDDLCKLTSQGQPANRFNAFCTNPDGSDFPTRAGADQNAALVAGQAGHADGGLRIGDLRALVALDYAFSPSFMLGVRAGYVLNTYPGNAAVRSGRAFEFPLHGELRATYFIGDAPLARVGFSPMLFVGGGVAPFDGRAASNVALSNVVGQRRVDIWITDGPWFATLGAGLRYQFSLRTAFSAAARANASFFDNGLLLTFGPEVGFQYGF